MIVSDSRQADRARAHQILGFASLSEVSEANDCTALLVSRKELAALVGQDSRGAGKLDPLSPRALTFARDARVAPT